VKELFQLGNYAPENIYFRPPFILGSSGAFGVRPLRRKRLRGGLRPQGRRSAPIL
jgi:hypothetical protein